ncbi:MAG: NADH-ubiquinone oxidoreductase-F iron-sulfur binding region domain-containing protein [Vescimonas sp.]|nr:NADH-ubiquinone oxidoreductase-F iron-sulfur binding region domain-containing protein [Vescimonas sp.]MDY5333387.1 NADH-ubiquinone oxidoreductase-F iron-sulfur binding region domain-containing protein [Vescimonas sp.]
MEQSRGRLNVLVCAGTGCIASGAMKVYDYLRTTCQSRGIPVAVCLKDEAGEEGIHLKKSGCHGFCEIGPLVCIEPLDILYAHVKVEDCDEIIEKTILGGEVIERLLYTQNGVSYQRRDDIPFYKNQHRVVLKNSGKSDAEDMTEYLALGGYTAFEKALFNMTGEEICREIANSGLRGRGGGGFPAGRKWESVRRHTEEPVKYIVCNGDEGDPGAFMDQGVMEGNPHSVLEGMMIAGVATGATEGYIYVRAEYPLAVKRLQIAIEKATEIGLLGDDIMGSGFSFRIHINRGAGAFVCGEGSALTASIEGKRGMPRVKPPRTVDQGLWGKPTVLNNVETFANVPGIINHGAQWYKGIGTESSAGTKTFALTGNVVNTGLVEVPMGTTLREIIFDIGGGIPNGKKFKAVQIGGPSGGCLTEEHLDYPMDFDSLKKLGAIIGSGGLVVMDEDTCMVEVARFFMHFTQKESCGKCTPCREGTKRMLETLERIIANEGSPDDLELLEALSDTITDTALCGLGQTACKPVMSTLRHFRQDYLHHVVDHHCPICNGRRRRLEIKADLCKGCGKCAKNCPMEAISGQLRMPYTIDNEKCIHCGACWGACPFGAIDAIEEE